jgi:hypothetical protein
VTPRPPYGHIDGKKRCSACHGWLPLEQYGRCRTRWDGLQALCTPCRRAESRKRSQRPEKRAADAAYQRARYVREHYGLTRDEYEELVRGECAICGTSAKETTLHLDHDHANGKIRASLCRKCNVGLGTMDDDPERLERAAKYLREWQRSHARSG